MNLADAVIEFHLVVATHSLHWPAIYRKDGRVPLLKRQNHRTRLHPRPLLGHHELATFENFPRLIQQYGNLYREYMFAVEVAVQAVVIFRPVFKQQRSRASLTRLPAALQERRMIRWKAHLLAHALMPLVGDGRETG